MSFWQIFSDLCDSIGKKPNPVGKELGIGSATITQWKNGSIPSGEKLVILAKYFGVSTDYLLGNTHTSSENDKEMSTEDIEIMKMIKSLSPEKKEMFLKFLKSL